MGNPLCRREDGLVHERVSAGFDNFRAGNSAILLNADFDRADERLGLVKNGRRLVPLAVEAIVDEFMIPGKLGGISPGS